MIKPLDNASKISISGASLSYTNGTFREENSLPAESTILVDNKYESSGKEEELKKLSSNVKSDCVFSNVKLTEIIGA